jgi:hypothetical protein
MITKKKKVFSISKGTLFYVFKNYKAPRLSKFPKCPPTYMFPKSTMPKPFKKCTLLLSCSVDFTHFNLEHAWQNIWSCDSRV